MKTDIFCFVLAGIFSQLDKEDYLWHPVAFWFRKMISAEENYKMHDQELLVIVMAFKHWRYYLEDSYYPVEILTDHQNLKGFINIKSLNNQQARWAIKLAAFDFVISHRLGKMNPVDALSHRLDYEGKTIKLNGLLSLLQKKLALLGLKIENALGEHMNVLHSDIARIIANLDLRNRKVARLAFLMCKDNNTPVQYSVAALDMTANMINAYTINSCNKAELLRIRNS